MQEYCTEDKANIKNNCQENKRILLREETLAYALKN